MNGRALLLRVAFAAGAVALSILASTRVADAQDPLPIRVEYEARAGCPDADAFTRGVLGRTPRARVASGDERARALAVRIHPAGRGFEGVLVLRDDRGTLAERDVRAQSCAELVAALAVIASVALDPLGDSPATTDDAHAADAGPPDTGPVIEPPSVPTVEGPVEPPSRGPWTVSAGAGLGFASGASPSLLTSVQVFGEVSRTYRGLLEPAARLRFQRTTIGGTDRAGGGARFILTTGGADLCPVGLVAGGVRAQACARGEGGALEARGNSVEPVRSEARPWFALGPVVRVRLELVGPLFAEIEGGLLALVVRDRFFVEPATLIYQPPAIAGTASFGIGLAFR